MLKDITLGQYFPGDTPVHRLDPRTKLILTVVYIAALFTANTWAGYGLVFLALAAVTALGHIPPRAMIRGLKPLLFIIVFTGILNLFFTTGDTYVFQWRFIHISDTGLRNAVAMVLRVTLLVAGTFLLTYTTSPWPSPTGWRCSCPPSRS